MSQALMFLCVAVFVQVLITASLTHGPGEEVTVELCGRFSWVNQYFGQQLFTDEAPVPTSGYDIHRRGFTICSTCEIIHGKSLWYAYHLSSPATTQFRLARQSASLFCIIMYPLLWRNRPFGYRYIWNCDLRPRTCTGPRKSRQS
jgi:hypothetical protein